MSAQEIEQAVDNKLIEWGIAYSTKFIPWSRSRNKDEKNPSLNWETAFQKPGETGPLFRVQYTQGIGNVPAYDHQSSKTVAGSAYYKKVAETGKAYDYSHANPVMKALPFPRAADVLQCLLLDDEARRYTFEDWAETFGYDTDSRKAEAIYRECLDVGIRLRYVFTQAQLNELAKLLEDY